MKETLKPIFVLTGICLIVAVLLAVIPALLLALMRLSKNRFIHGLSGAYIAVFRSTPLMVQLAIIYFGVFYIIQVPRVYIGFIRLDMFIPFVVSLALNSSAYVAEIFRAGILAVDSGQTEAARSLGLSQWQAMKLVVLPQAVKNILPALCNEFISTVKGTSLASVFFVGELMTSFKTVQSATFLALQSLTIVGIIYFLLNFILSRLLRVIERRLTVSD